MTDNPTYTDLADDIAELNERLGLTRRLSDGSLLQVPCQLFWPKPQEDEAGVPIEEDDEYFPRVLAEWPGVTLTQAKKVWKQFLADKGSYALIAYMIKKKAGLDAGE